MSAATRLNRLDLHSIQVVSWDVDGTLYSNRGLAVQLATQLAAATLRSRDLQSLRELRELGELQRQVELGRSDSGDLRMIHVDLGRRLEIEKRWLEPALTRMGPRRGVREVLEYFRGRVRAQVVFSDFESEYKLKCLDLEVYFAALYAGEHLGGIKPSTKAYLKILEDMDIPPQALLHIGDRAETDGRGAEAAGCAALVLGRDFRSFHGLLSELEQHFEDRPVVQAGD